MLFNQVTLLYIATVQVFLGLLKHKLIFFPSKGEQKNPLLGVVLCQGCALILKFHIFKCYFAYCCKTQLLRGENYLALLSRWTHLEENNENKMKHAINKNVWGFHDLKHPVW